MSTRIELMKSRMRAKLLAAQTEDDEDMEVDPVPDPESAGAPSQMTTSSTPPFSQSPLTMTSATSSSGSQLLELSSNASTSSSNNATSVLPPEMIRNNLDMGLSDDFTNAFGLPFAPQRSPRTPQNSHEAPESPEGLLMEGSPEVERASNSSENSSDTDINMRRRPTRSLGDDELCYAGDESSGIESPAMKRMNIKTANRRKFDSESRKADLLNSSNSLDDSTDNESRRRYYPNPYYQPPGSNKAQERAIRFNTAPRPAAPESERNNKIPDMDELITLYNDLGMCVDHFDDFEINTLKKKYRLDSVLVRGTGKMSSDDIFKYFMSNHQNPTKMEWVNDVQCIVIFEDLYEAGACLLNMSKPIDKDFDPEDRKAQQEIKYDELQVIPMKDVLVPMPPSHTWRFAVPCAGTRGILLTIAKKSDKKQPHAQEASEYYRTHGNPSRGDGIWTKKTYDQQHRQRRQAWDGSSSSTVQRFNEYKPPIHSRLNFGKGVPRKRGATAMDEEENLRRGAKVSRSYQRSRNSQHVSLYERAHGDSSSDFDYPYRNQEEEEASDNRSYGSSRQSTTYEDEDLEDEDYTAGSSSYYDRREQVADRNRGGPDRRPGGIKSRLY